jgi:hypothetical protein
METAMTSFVWTLVMVGGATCVSLMLLSMVASFFVAAPPDGIPTRRSEIRRYMFMGLYCNPQDPRMLVHRPNGMGWTFNFRSESMVMLFFVMLAVIFITLTVVAINALP